MIPPAPFAGTGQGVRKLAVLHCPGCGRGGLRVPDGKRGKVTCPRCGAEWFYPETIELNEERRALYYPIVPAITTAQVCGSGD